MHDLHIADRRRVLNMKCLNGLFSRVTDTFDVLMSLTKFKVVEYSTRTPMSFHIPRLENQLHKNRTNETFDVYHQSKSHINCLKFVVLLNFFIFLLLRFTLLLFLLTIFN